MKIPVVFGNKINPTIQKDTQNNKKTNDLIFKLNNQIAEAESVPLSVKISFLVQTLFCVAYIARDVRKVIKKETTIPKIIKEFAFSYLLQPFVVGFILATIAFIQKVKAYSDNKKNKEQTL